MPTSPTLLAGALAAIVPISASHAGNPAETVIHVFSNTAKGVRPQAAMIMDPAGHLYGML